MNRIKGEIFLFYFVLTILLFGPIFGLIDTSFFGSIIGLSLLMVAKKDFSFSFIKCIIPHYFIVLLLLLYSLLIYLLYQESSFYIIKFFKSSIIAITIPLFIYNYPLNYLYKLKILRNVLILNALVIFIQILLPTSQPLFASIYLFNKRFSSIRSFGLTTGFDSAGFYSIIGMLISFHLLQKNKRKVDIFLILLFITSVLLTSRTSMIIGIALFTLYQFKIILGAEKRIKIPFIITLIPQSFIFVLIFKIVYTTIILKDVSYVFNINLSQQFALTSLDDIANSHFFLPEKPIDTIFGMGMNPKADNGYVKTIFFIGVLGLGLFATTYLYLPFYLLSRNDKKNNNITKLFLLIILLQFVFNFKNLYFFSRGFYDIVLILFCISLEEIIYNNKIGLNKK
jgi:hypothetical protein